MPHDYGARERAEVRRRDRSVDDEAWIVAMLRRAPLACLATVAGGQPFINSNMFAYDQGRHTIYLHTARHGRTRANLEGDERVCLSVSEMGRLLPSREAMTFSVEYSGVVVFGRGAVVADADEAAYGLQLLLDKYFGHLRPGADYRPSTPEEVARTSVYRIAVEEWSGKRKVAADDFPGAFRYPHGG